MTLEEIAGYFPGGKWNHDRSNYSVCCSAHDDHNPSLSIGQGQNGGVVVHCHRECATHDVLAAVGLTVKDLAPPNGNRPAAGTIYRYDDERGEALYEVHRTPTKQFKVKQPGDDGKWRIGPRKVLFRLPELLAAPVSGPVLIAEGEKDALTLTKAGFVATTNVFGAGKWAQEYTDWLKKHLPAHSFVILPDNDEAGIKHADEVFHSLKHAGLKARTIFLPGLEAKGDVTDWLRDHSPEALRDLIDPTRSLLSGLVSGRALLKKHFEPIRWAVKGILPEGLAIFAGPSKSCKSWLCLELCIAVVSAGKVFGQLDCVQGDVLYLALEDSERRLQERLEILLREEELPDGLDLATDWKRLADGGEEALEAWLQAHPKARLVIIDVLEKVRPPKKQGNEYGQDYAALSSLQRLARDYRVCVLVVHHTRKAQADDPYDMISGTTGIQGASDTLLALMRIRGERDATLHYTGRDVESDAVALQWEDIECGWKLLGKAKDHRLSAERTAIMGLLADAAEPMSPSDLAALLEKPVGTIKVLLAKMVQMGQVKRTCYGKYGAVRPETLPF